MKTIDSNNLDHLPKNWRTEIDELKEAEDNTVSDIYGERPHLRNPHRQDNQTQPPPKQEPPPRKRILIFTTFPLMQLCRFSKWSLDGTFKACPVLWGQIMIVMAKVGPFWIPVCYSLLPDKEKDTYYIFLALIKHYIEKVLQLKFEVVKVITDYEVAVGQAVNKVWGAILRGCLFYFSQAVWRFCQTHKMAVLFSKNQEFCNIVKMVFALAHVPLKDLEETVQILRNYKFTSSWRLEGEREDMQKVLLDYVQDW